MFPDVTSVQYVGDYQLELIFADGVRGVIDLGPSILGKGGVFSSLEDKKYFAQVSVNHEIGTIVWPNNVDFDPEILYSQVTGKPLTDGMVAGLR